MRAYTFVKNVRGSLRITLESYDMQLARKDFYFASTVDKLVIPYKYALGLFISDGAKHQFDIGYFTIENYEDLKKEAISLGLAAGEARQTLSPAAVADIVREQNIDELDKILKSNNPVDLANLIVFIRENIDQVPGSIIQRVEEACGVELRIDE